MYLNHKDSRDQSLPNLVGSLLKQLVQHRAPAAPSEGIIKLWEVGRKDDTRPFLEDLVRTLRSELASFKNVYIVVDALDECLKETTRNELLGLLQDLGAENVSLMVTSRPLDNKFCPVGTECYECGIKVRRELYNCTICDDGDFILCEDCDKEGKSCWDESHYLLKLYACIEIKIRATKGDLQKYIDYKVDTEPRLSSFCRKDHKVKCRVIEKVILVAKGMFLAAKLLIDSLKDKPTPKAMTRALETLPMTLDEIYEKSMIRIEE